MQTAMLLAALAIPVLMGILVLRPMNPRGAGLIDTLSLAYGAGLGLIALGTFYRGVLSVPFNISTALPMAALLAGALLVFAWFAPRPGALLPAVVKAPGRDRKGDLLVALVLVWLALRVVFVLYEGFGRPVIAQDSWWSRNAKFFFYHGFALGAGDEHFFGKGYRMILGYPLLTYLNQIWVSELIGAYHEALMKAWSPLYLIASAGLVFSAVRKEGGALAGLLAAFFFTSAPLVVYHSMEAYSDVTLGYYVLAGGLMLWRYMEGGQRGLLVLSGLFFAMAGFTKSDGVMHLLAGGGALLAYMIFERRYDWKGLACFAAPVVFYLAPWFIFRAHYGLGAGHGYGTGLGEADEAGSILWSPDLHFEIWPVFLREVFLSVDHALVFAFLAFISVAGFRAVYKGNLKYLVLIVALVISGYLFVFTMTYDYVYVLNRMATNRNLISLTPLAFTVAGLAALRVLKGLRK